MSEEWYMDTPELELGSCMLASEAGPIPDAAAHHAGRDWVLRLTVPVLVVQVPSLNHTGGPNAGDCQVLVAGAWSSYMAANNGAS